MLPPRFALGLGGLLMGLWACGGNVVVDAATGGHGGASGSGGGSSSLSSSSGAGGGCPAGTCTLSPGGPCEAPTGPKGNTCCKCTDGVCSEQCECASPDTPIATPTGERPIASLHPGDLVYSVDGAQITAVPVLATHQNAVSADHRVVRVRLANGSTLDISRGHPTLDGRSFRELRAGGQLGGVAIIDVAVVSYGHDRTYDILPASDSGGYFAGGALVGSTLRPAARVDP